MSKRLNTLILSVLGVLLVVNCAKRGSITGGEKDETPPKFLKALPPNFSTNFEKNEIRIYFDEYIKLKDPQKQIIISPPMDPPPTIMPLGGASKYITIKFQDTLLENTTYSINFGESIEDNNEGNPYPFFRYVFSTGSELDSLRISGTVKDAIAKKPDSYITVALYEIDSVYSDSLVFKEVPRYITNTLDSIGFNMYNLKEGTYKLIALKDKSANHTFQPKQDKIGFYDDVVKLPTDTAKVFNINLFKEILDFKALKPKQESKNRLIFGYEGVGDSMKIDILNNVPNDFETRILEDQEKDTLYYWFKPYVDSLAFEVTNGEYRDTLITKLRELNKDSLILSSNTKRSLAFNQDFKILSNTPLESIDKEKINFTDKDTVAVPFTVALDKKNNEAKIVFEKSEENSYKLQLLPEAIKDFIDNVNDTINFRITTKKLSDYGKIFLTLENVREYPVIVEIISEQGALVASKITRDEKVLVFDHLDPGKYDIRVIYDTNDNGQWDTGNFLKKLQPEEVIYYPGSIEVRANWELKQTFILN